MLCLLSLAACGTLEIGVVQTVTPKFVLVTVEVPASEEGSATSRTPTPSPPEAPASTPTPDTVGWQTYENAYYRLSLAYPAHWQAVPGYGGPESGDTRYAGDDGFFHVTAMNAGTIDDAATSYAEHVAQPYGARPIIEHLQVWEQEARLILPSMDQLSAMGGEAMLIVRYPQSTTSADYPYQFLALAADLTHIRTIAQTLRFGADSQATAVTVTQDPPLTWEHLPPGLVYSTYDGLWLIDGDEQPLQLHNAAQAALSPDGTRLVSYDRRQQDLWLTNLAEGTGWNLTHTPDRVECCFRWWPARPDDIFFSSMAQGTEPAPGLMGYLSVVSIDGQGYQVLDPENDTGPGSFALSPDGQTIAYGGGLLGWLYRWGGVEPFDPADYGLLVREGAEIAGPAWSPDGTMLAWIVKANLAADGGLWVGVAVFDLESRSAWVIHPYAPQGVGWPPTPVWSPDEAWLAISDSSASDRAGLWVAPQ